MFLQTAFEVWGHAVQPLPLNTLMSSDAGSRRCFFIPSWDPQPIQGLLQILLVLAET